MLIVAYTLFLTYIIIHTPMKLPDFRLAEQKYLYPQTVFNKHNVRYIL